VHHAPEIDADDPLQVGVLHAFDGARQRHARVIEHKVHTLMLRGRFGGPVEHRGAVRYVEHARGDAQRRADHMRCGGLRELGGFGEARRIAVGQREVAAFARQPDRERTAHARARAGDGGHSVGEVLHWLISCPL
jgi:hypothetical protein